LVPVENNTRGTAVISPEKTSKIIVLLETKASFLIIGSERKNTINIARGVIKIVSNVTDERGSNFTLLFIKP